MLSIIISSYQDHYFQQLSENIHQTIGEGFDFEIVKIWNPGKVGICEAYNLGAEQSKYENLLFIHEDILFVENNWGEKFLKILNLPNCGVVGIAGGDYYSYVPRSWWNKGHDFLHFIQADKFGTEHFHNRAGFKSSNFFCEVKGLDGVFLGCSKKVYDDIQFDEDIEGYHGYDLIFSLKAAKKYTNYVTDQVLIKHFSKGDLSKDWFKAILKVKKIIDNFPDQKVEFDIELANFYEFIFYLKKFGFPRIESLKICLKYLNPNKLGFRNTLKAINRLRYL